VIVMGLMEGNAVDRLLPDILERGIEPLLPLNLLDGGRSRSAGKRTLNAPNHHPAEAGEGLRWPVRCMRWLARVLTVPGKWSFLP
jgi:hypothetical protein